MQRGHLDGAEWSAFDAPIAITPGRIDLGNRCYSDWAVAALDLLLSERITPTKYFLRLTLPLRRA